MASEALLSAFEVGDISTEALMFQAGYLTLDSVHYLGVQARYRLRFPNLEVKSSLNEALLRRFLPAAAKTAEYSSRLYHDLLCNDFVSLEKLFSALFAGIPNDWHRKNPIANYEGYYASVFYAYFAASGLDITAEESSYAGRLDMAVRFNQQIYLFEFKVVELEPEGRALQQIKLRGYADRYLAIGQPIHLIGVEFSSKRKTVVGFEVETLKPTQ